MQDIRPKLDTKDYYGNLAIHYTIINDDVDMAQKYFTKGKAYFDLRNFKYETIFHIAAKHNSIRSLTAILGKNIFIEELLKRDFKGDTPLHAAAKAGSMEIMEFYLTGCTSPFLSVKNDFGLTPYEALCEKVQILEDKLKADKLGTQEDRDLLLTKIDRLERLATFMDCFSSFITEQEWSERFDLSLGCYLNKVMDPNLSLMMDITNQQQAQVS